MYSLLVPGITVALYEFVKDFIHQVHCSTARHPIVALIRFQPCFVRVRARVCVRAFVCASAFEREYLPAPVRQRVCFFVCN